MVATHPTALISYSHDAPEHEARVLALCNRLRARGVDALCDQFLAGAPAEGWPLWMERQIEARDFTLLVCTEAYRRRFMEEEPAGIGRGVIWEARILRNLLYESSDWDGKIVPVLMNATDREFVPTVFRGRFYDLSEERGFEGLLRHLLREPGAEAAALGPLGPHNARWSAFVRPWLLPDAQRSPYFTGRKTLLADLRGQLLERGRAALSGLGGVGKTQAVFEYARQHREDYPDGVFWVAAETVGTLTSGFVEIANALNLAAAASRNQEQTVRAVLEWLNETDRWLLIFDNVAERLDATLFMPQLGRGHVLITSRESVFQEMGVPHALEVDELDDDEALDFLLTRTSRHSADSAEREAAAELASELGNLPLALEQAAAYVTETNVAFSDYLTSYRKRRIALLEKSKGLVAHPSVAFTWSANFAALSEGSAASGELLRVAAFLAPDAIPFELFVSGAPALGEAIVAALNDPEDPLAIAELLRPLSRYSLIRVDRTTRTLSVHRLVQETVRTSLSGADVSVYSERAIEALDRAFPKVEFTTWTLCERLSAHVLAVQTWIREHDLRSEIASHLLNETGKYLKERGRYRESKLLFEHALAIRECGPGPDHPDVAASLNGLAGVYCVEGRFSDAYERHERALEIFNRAFGPNHPEVATSLNGLAIVRRSEGRYAEAQSFFERVLEIWESIGPPDHPNVAASLNNLSVVHYEQGHYAQAQDLCERALAILERSIGADNPQLASGLDNLAIVLRLRGQFAEALSAHVRALEIRERVLGGDHLSVAWSLINIANVHTEEGRYREAQSLYERGRTIAERALGPDHPDAAMSLPNLAYVNVKQGRHAEAKRLYERALENFERTLGPDHVNVGECLAGLADIYAEQGDAAEALPRLERALAIKEKSGVAADNPDVVSLRSRLAALREQIARPPENQC
jgi:tetratricopeptide (TPR) repeat protein